jgi:hypothetical protein
VAARGEIPHREQLESMPRNINTWSIAERKTNILKIV